MSLKSQFSGLTPLLTWYRVFEESGRSFDVGSAPSLSISWYIKFTQADMVIFPEHVGQYCMKFVISGPESGTQTWRHHLFCCGSVLVTVVTQSEK